MRKRLKLRDFDKIFFHTGKRYREHLIPKLVNIGIRCEILLESLGIGKEKRWYREHEY